MTPSAYFCLASVLEGSGKLKQATVVVQEGLKKHPQSALLLLRQATVFMHAQELSKARREVDKCLKISPEYPLAHLASAEISAHEGNVVAAVESLGAALGYGYDWPLKIKEEVKRILKMLQKTTVEQPEKPQPEKPQPEKEDKE